MTMLRPWIELIDGTRRYGLRVGISNFRFEMGVLIGGFSHCDRYSDGELVEQHRAELAAEFVVQRVAEKQATTS